MIDLIPPDQLLLFNVKEGWKPLCQFLKKDIPSVPYPSDKNVNAAQISQAFKRHVIQDMVVMAAIIGVIIYGWEKVKSEPFKNLNDKEWDMALNYME